MRGPGAEPLPPGPSLPVTARDVRLADPERHILAGCDRKPWQLR